MIIQLKTPAGETLYEAHLWVLIMQTLIYFRDPQFKLGVNPELYADGRKIDRPESFEDEL